MAYRGCWRTVCRTSSGDGFEYWLLKFDGVANNRDRELNDPQGFGAIEYAYYLRRGRRVWT